MCPHVTLTIVEGPHRGQVYVSDDRPVITIGRSPECTLCLSGPPEDMLISRRHCLIGVYADHVEIRDLESRNGTYLNGQRLGFPTKGERSTIFRRPLKDGDQIALGTTLMQVGLMIPAETT